MNSSPHVVKVIEVLSNGDTKGREEYEFIFLPSPGDRVVLQGGLGDLDIMNVLYVEHSPVKLPRYKASKKNGSVMLYVEFIERFSG